MAVKITEEELERFYEEDSWKGKIADPTISREDAKNIALQMKKIQDEERKNPKPTHDEDGLLIMRD
jgi:hypothetical protein